MERDADVQEKHIECFAHGWKQEIDVADKIKYYGKRFLNALSESQHMCDRRLRCITTAKHQTDFHKSSNRPVHSALYCTSPKNREFEKTNIDKMLSESITQPAQAEQTSLILRVKDCIGSLRNAAVFSTLDASSGYW